jgi:hypothetical protein
MKDAACVKEQLKVMAVMKLAIITKKCKAQ